MLKATVLESIISCNVTGDDETLFNNIKRSFQDLLRQHFPGGHIEFQKDGSVLVMTFYTDSSQLWEVIRQQVVDTVGEPSEIAHAGTVYRFEVHVL